MKNNNPALIMVVAVVVGALAFFGGVQYQKSQAASNGGGQFAQGGSGKQSGRERGRARFGGALVGKIVSQDANSITVQMQDGSSKIVNISSGTRIIKSSVASKSDLAVGQAVAASGTSNSDGSLTADRVQLNPQMIQDRQGGTQPIQSQ